MLKKHGIDHVFIDTSSVAERVRKKCLGGVEVEKVLELVDTTALAHSLKCARRHGAVCMSGMVGDRWTLNGFEPMEAIPTAVSLTTYSGGATEFMATPLQRLVEQVENGTLPMKVGRVFRLEDIVEAHRCMEANEVEGKIVVVP